MENVNEMAELKKINSKEVQEFYQEIYQSQLNRAAKCKERREVVEQSSLGIDSIDEEDETSIYEYDYDCIKKSGFLDKLKKESTY